VLNTWNGIYQRKLGTQQCDCDAIRGRLSECTPRKLETETTNKCCQTALNWAEHVELNWVAQTGEMATRIQRSSWKRGLGGYSTSFVKAGTHQGNWQPQLPRIVISLNWTHVTEWSSANWGNGNATRGEAEKLNFQATEHASLLLVALPRGFLVTAIL
jgi:hypothetical protein